LVDLIELTIIDFDGFAEVKNIEIRFEKPKEKVISFQNRVLYQILFSNLIGNAVKHNIKNVFLNITFKKNQIIIENSGLPLKISPERLFERFVKGSQANMTPGLGLAIVEKICAKLKITVQYSNADSIHRITITV